MAPPSKYPVEYSTALISMCFLYNSINSVLFSALIRIHLITSGFLLSVKFAADGFSTMGLKKANLLIGIKYIIFVFSA